MIRSIAFTAEVDVISPEKIDEWLHEVEERPSSSGLILRYIANRLRDLTERNEELQAENIALRTGRRVEEYEARISNLEYQLDLLKRQWAAGVPQPEEQPAEITTSLILYNNQGRVLRLELTSDSCRPDSLLASFKSDLSIQAGESVAMLWVSSQEELAFVLDSGRVLIRSAAELPAVRGNELDWESAYEIELNSGEELATAAPVGRMALHDYALQVSRRGYVKKQREDFFEAHLQNGYIGTGTKIPQDRTCALLLAGKGDRLVLASLEGYAAAFELDLLPQAIEEAIRLGKSDHLAGAFTISSQESLLFLTNSGKIIHREPGWLDNSPALKQRGQSMISSARRASGVRLVAAAAVSHSDWGAALFRSGRLVANQMADLFASGSLIQASEQDELLSFTVLP
jgi:DNA gyrase/topoisomerase IV subunit A